jgi:hypothetical protein
LCWAARGAEGVVIALDFSSTRWATFFALSSFCSFYYMSGWTLPANLYRGLIPPLVHSVVPSLPPFRQFHTAHYLQTRESVGTSPGTPRGRALSALELLSSSFTWPVASACLGNAAFPSRDRRGSSARTSKRDASIVCAGHGNLFYLPPTLRRRGSAQGVSAAGSLPPLLALDWPSCWPFGQAPACPFECARVVVFYNYFERSWFC